MIVIIHKNIDNIVVNKVKYIVSNFSNVKFITLDKLQSQLINQIKFIKRYYKEINYKENKSEIDKWIYDNYYILEKEVKTLEKSIKNVYLPTSMNKQFPDIYYIFTEVFRCPTFKISTDSLIEIIDIIEEERYLKNFEIDFLITIIKTSIINVVYNIIFESINNFNQDSSCTNIGTVINNMRLCNSIDIEIIISKKNSLDKVLQNDFDGIYNKMNDATKKIYRYKISKISLKQNKDEIKLAEYYLSKSLKNNVHIGEYIYEEYDKYIKNKLSQKIYIPLLFTLSFLASFFVSIAMGNLFWILLIYFPMWEILKPIVDYFCTINIESEYTPRLELNGKIPDESKVVVVISVLLTGTSDLIKLKKKLEGLYYKNQMDNIYYCILADLKESNHPVMNDDKNLVNSVAKVIRILNKTYNNKFMVFVRNRVYCKTQGVYTGYERKRGAISNLVSFIKQHEIDYKLFEGDYNSLKQCKYILALDYDTGILLEGIENLVSIAMHPMNKPIIDKDKRLVKKGYGIISPRMSLDLKESLKTPFSKNMGGIGGTSVYDIHAIDIYQDLYNEGIFCGKGLICIDSFYSIMIDIFPDNKILSHDILEGSFLRTRFVSDIEFIDGYPNDATTFFKRLHRWIRGDFQNISYLFKNIKTLDGYIKNPLNFISKFKLFDNLRRAITPIFILSCFIISLFLNSYLSKILVIIGFLSATFTYIFGIINSIISGEIFSLSRKYYSRVIPKTLELITQCFYNLIFLPKFAVNSVDAISRSLYRLLISKKKLLEWTTAAQTAKMKNGFTSILSYYWISEVIGFIFIFSSRSYIRFFGILFSLLIPLVIYSKGKYSKKNNIILEYEREEIISLLTSMWNFYNDYSTKSENYLPPDNVQEMPIFRVAHRTSPTNIGLMMLSMLSVRDFNVIDTNTLYKKLDCTLTTVEKLEKWNGNLYNWYDTKSLSILQPSFVSTVDSGNFVCCLVALKEGLKEYIHEKSELRNIIKRIEDIIDNTNIGVFYDNSKKVLRIGYDSTNNCFSDSHYDMLMSEARMTSYFAVAKRQVPKKHWSALGRTLAKLHSYTGPISWTGTMFEYFMPELLLQCEEGSLGYEGLRFCLYCQKQRAKQKGVPFGISESGYYAFDNQLNYQYKAYGVQKIALKKGMNQDLVISPYSSYLTLSYDFLNSLKNLRWLKKLGAFGKYGHYEALDFTESRVGFKNYMIIKSYMAHHIGMSIVAISNALCNNIMQKRFLQDNVMNSASELLQEKVSVGAVVFEDIYLKENDRKSNISAVDQIDFNKLSPANPRVKILSNGNITSVLTDIGASYIKYQGKDITKRSTDLIRNPVGIIAGVKLEDEVVPFTFAPIYNDNIEYSVSFGNNSVTYITDSEKIQTGMKVSIHAHLACEQRMLVIKNKTNQKQCISCMLYLQPVLASYIDDSAHPVFSKLFIDIEYDKRYNILIAKRKMRDNSHPIYFAVGFVENIEFEYETNREKILDRPNGISSIFNSFDKSFSGGKGTPDPCIALRFKSIIQSNQQNQYRVLIISGDSKDQIVNDFITIRNSENISADFSAKSPLAVDSLEGKIADTILPAIMHNNYKSESISEAIKSNTLNVTHLWKFGISGDLPIILLYLNSRDDIDTIKSYIDCQRKLRLCGIEYDIVIFYDDSNDGMEDTLINFKNYIDKSVIGIKGGVHLINILNENDKNINLIKAVSCYIGNDIIVNNDIEKYVPIKFESVNKSKFEIDESSDTLEVNKGVFFDDSFIVKDSPTLPWCHILANQVFGTLVSDKSLGFTFAFNSRENKITPWSNDTMTDNYGEMLIIKLGNKYFDIISGSTAIFNPNYVEYRGEFDNIKTIVRVSVPTNGTIKNISLTVENCSVQDIDLKIVYYIEPILGVNSDNCKHISCYKKENILYIKNPFNQSVKSYVGILSSEDCDFICDKSSFMKGDWDKIGLETNQNPCVGCIVQKNIKSESKLNFSYKMIFASSEHAIKVINEINPCNEHKNKNKIKINTKDKYINFMFNTWLPWQNLASRIYARTGFFQCGGAYGFRDQLQDVSSYVLLNPVIARTHIIRACSSQFFEGDVLHWWHNLPKYGGGKKGVRTRYSDDLLWLPYTLCEYISKTNDYSILDVEVYYLDGEQLLENEHEKYLQVNSSDKKETVYYHCIRAIEKACKLGENNIPLMGSGDWNDGYNKVGHLGKGESVWLAEFLSIVLEKFSFILDYKNDNDIANKYREYSKTLLNFIDENCWDGNYYVRAFFDNGEKMGSHISDECKIDSLSQSFSVISNMPDKERVCKAIDYAYEKLVDKEYDIIKLFSPPFDKSKQNPGYVKSYPVGVRENGGQYTHASVWFAMANLMLGEKEKGYELIKMLNPAYRYTNKELSDKYMLEPYYMAADIYTNPNAYARGGWSLYTGAAGWYYKVILEYFLGVKIFNGIVKIKPMVPDDYTDFDIYLEYDETILNIKVRKKGEYKLIDNGRLVECIELDKNYHDIEVNI